MRNSSRFKPNSIECRGFFKFVDNFLARGPKNQSMSSLAVMALGFAVGMLAAQCAGASALGSELALVMWSAAIVFVWARFGVHGRTAVAACLLLPSIAVSNVVFFNLVGNFTAYGFAGFLFWANLLLLVAVYVLLLPPALRRVPS